MASLPVDRDNRAAAAVAFMHQLDEVCAFLDASSPSATHINPLLGSSEAEAEGEGGDAEAAPRSASRSVSLQSEVDGFRAAVETHRRQLAQEYRRLRERHTQRAQQTGQHQA